MIKKYGIENSQVIETNQESAPIWLAINPENSEKKYLIETFGIDEHNLSSALDPEEPPRLEFDGEHITMIFKRPKNYSSKDQFLFKVSSMGMFLSKERLVIVLSEDIPLFTGKYFKHVEGFKEIFLKLIYNSIFHFLEHLKVINMIADEIETKISHSMENRYLLNMFTLEKSLVYYLNAINSNGYVFERLRHNGDRIGFSKRSMEFLDDIIIENSQCYRQAEIYSNIFASLMDARVSIVNNNLNILMRNLNILIISLMMPTLIVSLFSMNVALPFQQHPLAFVRILIICAIAVILFLIWWKKIGSK